ncbi:MAG: BREX-1 system adenine-specific DNA-methyltransferase PglX [Spirochaetia bacterium]|nr:BREX-1 system adenine-specific DNA-methyltransferase PglX [Spirochaetia bacterium]
MDLNKLKKFSRNMRVKLIEQIEQRLNYVVGVEDEYTRAHAGEIKIINKLINKEGKEQFLEEVAYTWFNRLAALRYMDVKGYNKTKIVSPSEGESQSQLLAVIKQGKLPEEIKRVSDQVFGYLDGKIKAQQPDREAYRTALLAMCNDLGRILPFLFKQVDDWAALLLPTDLLSPQSIIAEFREGMGDEECSDVEIIGWLYQFYIAEKKNKVIGDLKKNKKIEKENIPAATQLFTPHWIVRYMTENSLGRLWMLNRPESKIIEGMEYYIPSEDIEDDFLIIRGPEEIKICDPACGSGHMLTYAFDLLYRMYEEDGYSSGEIPELIIRNNLYGLEIDERAGELAAFALTMKARERDRYFFRRGLYPMIRVLHPVDLSDFSELKELVNFLSGDDIDRDTVLHDLRLFKAADNFGSLLRPSLTELECEKALKRLDEYEAGLANPSLEEMELVTRCRNALGHARMLSRKYHVVIANPPYMGNKGLNNNLKSLLQDEYLDVKSDLFSAFIVRNTELTLPQGQLGFMTPFVWMFISSYEKLRLFMIDNKTITSLVQLEYSGFEGATVPVCTFTLENAHKPKFRGGYVRLADFKGAAKQGPKALEIIQSYRDSRRSNDIH